MILLEFVRVDELSIWEIDYYYIKNNTFEYKLNHQTIISNLTSLLILFEVGKG